MKKSMITAMLLAASLMAVPVFTAHAQEATAAVEESGQNPVMNYIGDYGYARATLHVEADGMDGAKVLVTWGSSAFDHGEWEMSGSFDPETRTITYDNAVLKTVAFNEDGTTASEETVYENGSGTITFRDGAVLTAVWADDHGDVPEDAVFEFIYPISDEETEAIEGADDQTAEEPFMLHGNTETEITDGVMTIRIAATDHDDPAFHWQAWTEDKGDASFTELVTETDMEEGYAYVGSFRAIDDGEDTIRLAHTDGHYVAGYMDFNVRTENGKIVETIGGSEGFPSTGEDMAPVLAGTWQETDGTHFMEIGLGENGGLDITISDGSGRDGKTTFYTMTAYYDAIRDCLVYWNGTVHEAGITAETDAAAEEAIVSDGSGTGKIGFVGTEEEPGLVWQDDTFGNTETGTFVKAE